MAKSVNDLTACNTHLIMLLSHSEILKILPKYRNNLKFFHLNAQSLARKRTQLKNLFNDIGENTIFGISETWLSPENDVKLWNILSETHILFRNDRKQTKKQKGGGVALYVPKRLSPREMKNLNLFDENNFESLWIECKKNYQSKSNDKMLINITYCPQKNLHNQFLDELALNLDNAISVCNSVYLMGDYNINYLDRFERNNLDSVIIPYGLNVCSSETPTRITQSSETHIDYIIGEDTSKNIVFESNFKSDHLSSLLITQTKITKKKPRKFVTFDKKK